MPSGVPSPVGAERVEPTVLEDMAGTLTRVGRVSSDDVELRSSIGYSEVTSLLLSLRLVGDREENRYA